MQAVYGNCGRHANKGTGEYETMNCGSLHKCIVCICMSVPFVCCHRVPAPNTRDPLPSLCLFAWTTAGAQYNHIWCCQRFDSQWFQILPCYKGTCAGHHARCPGRLCPYELKELLKDLNVEGLTLYTLNNQLTHFPYAPP